jgi:hypothetical protein
LSPVGPRADIRNFYTLPAIASSSFHADLSAR